MTSPKFRVIWPNQPEFCRVRVFASVERLQAYVAEVLAVALRNHVRLRVTWVSVSEVRIERAM